MRMSTILLLIFVLTTCNKRDYGCQSCVYKLNGAIKWNNSWIYFIDHDIVTISIYLDEFEVVKDANVFLYDSETELTCSDDYWFNYNYTVTKSYGDFYEAHLKFFDQDNQLIYTQLVELPLDDDCEELEITLQ